MKTESLKKKRKKRRRRNPETRKKERKKKKKREEEETSVDGTMHWMKGPLMQSIYGNATESWMTKFENNLNLFFF